MNDISLPSPTLDVNVKNPISTNQQLTDKIDSFISTIQKPDQNLSPPYLALSVGDNQNLGGSDFQRPLFHQQQIVTTSELGYEKGDRIRLVNETKLNEYRKQKLIPLRKHRVERSKSNYRPRTSKNRIRNTKEKKKKVSKKNLNKRNHVNKTVHRKNIQQHRYQVS